jgi:hypothetical protein
VRPSGEKNGLMSSEGESVNGRSAPEATSALQMFAVPERDEKKTIVRESGDQLAW